MQAVIPFFIVIKPVIILFTNTVKQNGHSNVKPQSLYRASELAFPGLVHISFSIIELQNCFFQTRRSNENSNLLRF